MIEINNSSLPNSSQGDQAANEQIENSSMTILEHLGELRFRLLWCLGYLVIGTFIMFSFSSPTFEFLSEPYFRHFPASSLIGTGPAEAFILKLKVAFFASILVMSPLLFHQLWLFVKPGLYEHEKKLVVPFVAITSFLFIIGCLICHKVILPVTYSFFFEQYQSVSITPQIRITESLSLSIRLMLGFGLAFETPVVTYFLARGGLVTHTQLIGWMRYAVLIVFILAGVITPSGDVMTQLLFAVPMMGLYLVSILVAKLANRTS